MKKADKDNNSVAGECSKPAASRHARKEKRPRKKITETYLHNSGLYYLQRYAASTAQFRAVMQRKIDKSCHHHPDQDAAECARLLDALVMKFCSSGLLNDAVYTRGSVTSMRRRGLSQRVILMKLQQKGLSETQIKQAMEEFNTENQTTSQDLEFEAAMKLARKKKIGPYAVGPFDRNKALAAFARAGFSFEVSGRVLSLSEEDAP